jgi:hypothetical protein
MASPFAMPDSPPRRSTRVLSDVVIEVKGEKFAYAGEALTVNLHGALIKTAARLDWGTALMIYVHRTGKSARARVVFVSKEDSSQYGVELEDAENIWGVEPPSDWQAEGR